MGKKTKKNSLATGLNDYNRKKAVAQKWHKRLHNGVRYQALQQTFLTSATTWYEIRFIYLVNLELIHYICENDK